MIAQMTMEQIRWVEQETWALVLDDEAREPMDPEVDFGTLDTFVAGERPTVVDIDDETAAALLAERVCRQVWAEVRL